VVCEWRFQSNLMSWWTKESDSCFNYFIANILFDLLLHDICFTWYRGDGSTMSRLDCFLLSEEWCAIWPHCIQTALPRGVSNHCPVLSIIDEENLGPRPQWLLKCWPDLLGYHQFVKENLSDIGCNKVYKRFIRKNWKNWTS